MRNFYNRNFLLIWFTVWIVIVMIGAWCVYGCFVRAFCEPFGTIVRK